ncbi:hypothetical protein [Mesotoga prima]|uniref:hypothetical protein n=1 Tax=Mesotoga prima TaxID=1184387 RepID=UPI002FD88FF4
MPACGMLLDTVATTVRNLSNGESKYMWFELDGEDMLTYCISDLNDEEANETMNKMIDKKNSGDFYRTLDVKEKYIKNLMYSLDIYISIERIEMLVYQLDFFSVLESTVIITGRKV